MTKEKFLIVDGSNLLFQMFFGMPSRIINKDGKAIQGTLGFAGALLKTVRTVQPSYATVIFDGEHKNARALLNENYKANRTSYAAAPETENPFSQLPDIYRALDCIGIKHAETTDCEADDIIAGYAASYADKCDIFIMSNDSDFFQLITDSVSVYRYRGSKSVICTPQYVLEKFNITPDVYADFKSLTGDSSDNLKGAYKVGPKTASLLLNEFGKLENILSYASSIRQSAVRDSIIENTERLKINYKLIKLENSFPLPFSLEEIKFTYNGKSTNDVLAEIGLK